MTSIPNSKSESITRTWLLVIGIACLLVVFGLRALYLSMLEVPSWAKSRIHVGMDRSEVLELLGPPTGARSTDTLYDYDRPEVTGWYAVYFDENGKVTRVDDESF